MGQLERRGAWRAGSIPPDIALWLAAAIQFSSLYLFSRVDMKSEMRVDARQAARDGRLVDLVCIAATIPPVLRIKTWNSEPVIDAGTIDNAPLPRQHSGRTLVLLTRSYRNLPHEEGRTYVAPSHATPADKIDFTDADALKATYAQGQRDKRRILESAAS